MNACAPWPDLTEAKRRLVCEAERAFGEHGITAASLRDITQAAGHRNKSAAQYHFGGRDGLVTAILSHRRPQVDRLRQMYLDRLGLTPEAAPMPLLVQAILEPMLFSEERHLLRGYGRFLYALIQYDADGGLWRQSSPRAPFTHRLYIAMRDRAGLASDERWTARQRIFGRCCVDIIAHRHVLLAGDDQPHPRDREDIASMLSALLTAPTAREAPARPG